MRFPLAPRDVWVGLGTWIGVNLLVALYVSSERALYIWDYANYWNQFDHYTRLLRESPRAALRDLIGSIKYAEYNGLAAFLLTPVGLLCGTSRLAYVLGVTNLFALPAAALAAWAFGRCALAPATLLAAALFWHPVLRGFETVGGLIPALWLTGLWRRRSAATWTARDLALAATLLAAAVLFRRIYAYWALGFGVAAVAVEVLPALRRPETRRAGLVTLARWALVGAGALLILLLLARPITLSMLANDFRALYRLYRVSAGWASPLHALWQHATPAWILTALAGAFWGLRRLADRKEAAFHLFQLVVTWAAFLRVQDFHRHHFYLLVPGLLGLALIALRRLPGRAHYALPATLAAGSLLAFTPALRHAPPTLFALLAPVQSYPMQRDDLPELARLLRWLDTHPEACDPARGVYLLASSEFLNDELLRAARRLVPTDGPRAVIRATANKDDPRFGFPRDLLAAAVVLVADPPQLHAGDGAHQAAVVAPLQALRDASAFASAYTLAPERFTLDRGITITPFFRTGSAFTPDQIADLRARFADRLRGHDPADYPFPDAP
jgi:hypothetical protein